MKKYRSKVVKYNVYVFFCADERKPKAKTETEFQGDKQRKLNLLNVWKTLVEKTRATARSLKWQITIPIMNKIKWVMNMTARARVNLCPVYVQSTHCCWILYLQMDMCVRWPSCEQNIQHLFLYNVWISALWKTRMWNIGRKAVWYQIMNQTVVSNSANTSFKLYLIIIKFRNGVNVTSLI